MKFCFAFLLLLCSPLGYCDEFKHFNEWNTEQKVVFSSFVGASIIDYKMTEYALSKKGLDGEYLYYEANPLLGKRPSDLQLGVAQLIGIGSFYYFIGKSPDNELTKAITYGILGIRLGVIIHNDSVGIGFNKVF